MRRAEANSEEEEGGEVEERHARPAHAPPAPSTFLLTNLCARKELCPGACLAPPPSFLAALSTAISIAVSAGLSTMLLLCFPLALVSLSAPRDEVSFDFGWRFTTGLSTHPAQSDEPPPASADPGLHPAEAQTGYDDSGWAEVQLPHDGLIAAAASSAACRDGCSGKSYIPRHVLWYRKAFTLPAEWAGSLLFLDFEGSFRKTTVWLDGELLAAHDLRLRPSVPSADPDPKPAPDPEPRRTTAATRRSACD